MNDGVDSLCGQQIPGNTNFHIALQRQNRLAIFARSFMVFRPCKVSTHCSLRLVLQKNSHRRCSEIGVT